MSASDGLEQLENFGVNATLFQLEGIPIKFYIQDPPNIDEETHAALERKITACGGEVLKVIPRQGLIVYNANKSKSFGARWSDTNLHKVVHMSWIDKCIEIGGIEEYEVPMDDEPVPVPLHQTTVPLDKRILRDMVNFGEQLPVHLHFSVKGTERSRLCRVIEANGGFYAVLRSQARVILVDDSEENLEDIQKLRYECGGKDQWVENTRKLEQWIKEGTVELTKVNRTGMPGRRAGSKRTEFTPDDDMILVEHIARQIPDEKSGGRSGYELYVVLESRLRARATQYYDDHDDSAEAKIIQHAAEHPAQGWRERYRNNTPWFKQEIEAWLDRHEYIRERGGEWPRAIGYEKNSRGNKGLQYEHTPAKRKAVHSPTDEDEDESESEDEDLIAPQMRNRNKRQSGQARVSTRAESTDEPPVKRRRMNEKETDMDEEADVELGRTGAGSVSAETRARQDRAQEAEEEEEDGFEFEELQDDFLNVQPPPIRSQAPLPSQPPPTYRTQASQHKPREVSSSSRPKTPPYRRGVSAQDSSWIPLRHGRQRPTQLQARSTPPARMRSQAPEPPTPGPPVAQSTPRPTALASPVRLRAAQQAPHIDANTSQPNGEADSELLEVEAQLGSTSSADHTSQEAVPKAPAAAAEGSAVRAVSMTESSQDSLVDPPTPTPGVQQLLEQAEALLIDADQPARPVVSRASEPLRRPRQFNFSDLPADQTRYPTERRRASAGPSRRTGGRVSLNDVLQQHEQERQQMINDLRAAHGFYFEVSVVAGVLHENGDDYAAADDVLSDMQRLANGRRTLGSNKGPAADDGSYRPGPGTRAAIVRKALEDAGMDEPEPPRAPVRRTRAAVAAGLVRDED